MAIAENELEMMARINAEPHYDDANHTPAEQELARRLYRKGMIEGAPVEGSDAAVDHLFLTDIGQLALKWYGPTSDDDAVVDWYALRMKQKLAKRSTDATKGVLNWRHGPGVHDLFERLMMEVGELAEALFRNKPIEDVIGESVDVGAMAMMIADKVKFRAALKEDRDDAS